MAIMRIGHVSLRVTDVGKARAHYERVIGLYETHRDGDGTTYYKCWDEWDRYSVVITPAERAGAEHVAFKVECDADLDLYAGRLAEHGVAVERLGAGAIPFVGPALRFALPNTTRMVLYAEKEVVGRNTGAENPDPWPDDIHGCGAMHLDHCLLVAELDPARGVNRVADSAKLLVEALDFQLTERLLGGPNGDTLGLAFLACGGTPHDIAFAGGPVSGFHHMAFYLDSWDDVRKAADIMGKNRTRIDYGPTRHGMTRGSTIYFFDPSGNRNEVFAGLGYRVSKDMPVITWTEENVGRGIFFPTGEVNAAFREEYTPAA